MSRSPRCATVVALLLCTAACAGLPSRRPAPMLPATAPLSGPAGEHGTWPMAEWWKGYGDPALDRCIELALEHAPTLASAHARFDTARQSVRIAGAAAGAHVDLAGDGSRQRLSDNGLFPPNLLGFHWYDQFDLGLQASYTFDWWGKQRDSVEAAMDEAHASAAERQAAALMLAGAVANAYVGWQGDQARLALARERASTVEREGRLVALRIAAELESGDAARNATATLADARENIAALQGSAQLRVVTLAALIGRPADELPPLTPRPLPPLGAGLPDDVSLDLLARRADLTASRWRIEAAEKNSEAARADFYPDISVNALAGLQSIDVGKLLRYSSRVPGFGAAIHLPLFDAGRLKARYGASQAAIDAAVANYQETLVGAARDVATQAASRARLEAQRAERAVQVDAALQLRDSAAARVRQGLSDARSELAADEAWLTQRDALLQLDAAALSADIELQSALGGGYRRNDTTPMDATP